MTPGEHEVVLVGAGNAHLQIVKWWGMDPMPGVSLTLVSDAARMPYSGMLPGCIAGAYTRGEVEIDVSRLCAANSVRLILAEADRIAYEDHLVHLADRPPIRYDLLSLNIGSQPQLPINEPSQPDALLLKPLCSLLDRVDALDARARAAEAPFPIVVVGGGASGFEICLALHARFADCPHVDVILVTSGNQVLSGAGSRVSRAGSRVLAGMGVQVHLEARVVGADRNSLQLDTGTSVSCATCVWATHAGPTELIARSGFAADERGFLKAHDSLQSLTDPSIFATGDCVSLASNPRLPKAGIFAVREGPILWENLRASIEGEPLNSYRPQKLYLFLLNTSDGSAIVNYGPFSGSGAWAFRWKDFIDRRWTQKLHEAYAGDDRMARDLGDAEDMRCGGCGSKLGREVLQRVLSRLEIASSADLLLGCRPGDDAAVIRVPPGKLQLQTTDFFKSFVDDPYIFGQIAAINALSDIYAMNGKPSLALALVTLPEASDSIRENQLFQVLSGALETFRAHDVVLAGGHTSESIDFQVGFTLTGYADEGTLYKKEGLKHGDQLILTKPIGTGSLLRAAAMGLCDASDWQAVIAGMLMSNATASEVFAANSVTACTDVTGFGLAGHLLEMLDASKVSARVTEGQVPLYPGFPALAAAGQDEPVLSTLHEENARCAERIVSHGDDVPAWLFDPQTSGGLLAGVAPAKVESILAALRDAGCTHSAHVGEIVEKAGEQAVITLV